jgi:hypothetical protein
VLRFSEWIAAWFPRNERRIPEGIHLARTANDAVFFDSAVTLGVTLAVTLLIRRSAGPSGHWVRFTGPEIAAQRASAGR